MRHYLAPVVLAALAMACQTARVEPTFLHVFDCYLPIPPGYAVIAPAGTSFQAYLRTDSLTAETGRLMVSEAHEFPADDWAILSTREVGGLSVSEVGHLSADSSTTGIVISDGAYQILLLGEAKRHADSMVKACIGDAR